MDAHEVDRRADGRRRFGRLTCVFEPHQNVPQIGDQIDWEKGRERPCRAAGAGPDRAPGWGRSRPFCLPSLSERRSAGASGGTERRPFRIGVRRASPRCCARLPFTRPQTSDRASDRGKHDAG
jgi:hypothetical protein